MDERETPPAPQGGEPDKPDFEAGDVHLVRKKGRFAIWCENVWYHYKVPIIIALVLIVALSVCIVQCAKREPTPDYILCYAGEASLLPTKNNTVAADMAASAESLLESGGQRIGNGVRIDNWQVRKGAALDSYNKDSIQSLQNELSTPIAYLYLLSEHTFDVYTTTQGGRLVVPVAEYLPADSTVEITPDGYGVYLRSTPAASLPGFRDLPDDTVLCLRIPYAAFSHGNSARQQFDRSEALFRAMLGVAAE